MISGFRYRGAEGNDRTGRVRHGFLRKSVLLSIEEYGGKILCQKGALLCASRKSDI